jgi:predicted glycosyltransferase
MGEIMKTPTHLGAARPRSVWIDLDNSPHVPFFAPIIEELRRRGYSVLVTARDCFQVCELADLLGVQYKRIGRHYGKYKIVKVVGLCIRAIQLTPTVLMEKPDVALSHGSRSQLLLSSLVQIPSIVVVDYEFVKGFGAIHPTCMMFPEVIDSNSTHSRIMKYPGIKEDVYVPRFRPDPAIMTELGVSPSDLMVTLRPPANEAHYHNPESEALLEAVINLLGRRPATKVILLPRNKKQEMSIRKAHPEVFATGNVMVPDHAVDGLNLIWHSDFVVSGGGTMNREAAALGVPVYSIFRGEIGAVDRYLESVGRLVLIKSVEEVRTRIAPERRCRPIEPEKGNNRALMAIVDNVVKVMESTCPSK